MLTQLIKTNPLIKIPTQDITVKMTIQEITIIKKSLNLVQVMSMVHINLKYHQLTT